MKEAEKMEQTTTQEEIKQKIQITVSKPKHLKDVLGIMARLGQETELSINKECLNIRFMDLANVSLTEYKLNSAACETWNINENVMVWVNIRSFQDVLKNLNKNDKLNIAIDDKSLILSIEGDFVSNYKIPLLEESKSQKVPELKYPDNRIEIESKPFFNAIKGLKKISESAVFKLIYGNFFISGDADINNIDTEISFNSEKIYIHQTGLKSKYSIDYLLRMATAYKISENMNIYFNTEYPLTIEYKKQDLYKLKFILAPKVSDY